MLNFLLSGVAMLFYACIMFWRTKIIYLSIVFSTMWELEYVVTRIYLH